MILRLAISVEHRLMVDKQTDRQTHNDGICIYRASMALRGKNGTLCYEMYRGIAQHYISLPLGDLGHGPHPPAWWDQFFLNLILAKSTSEAAL